MVSDLFAAESEGASRQPSRRGASRATNAGESDGVKKFFEKVVIQVQENVCAAVQTPSTMNTLASYYVKTSPQIDGRPFCVALSDVTFLFHMQMARIADSDVDVYAQLLVSVIEQIPSNQLTQHPFIQNVIRDKLLGLSSPTCSKPHFVVMIPPHQYRAFARLVTILIVHNVMPSNLVAQWQSQLQLLIQCSSPMVALRAQSLLVQTLLQVDRNEQVGELHAILRSKKHTLNSDLILTSYERLKRVVPDPEEAPPAGRALVIHCSEIFLKFRSPIRREYLERFLYPSLCSEDMAQFVDVPSTRDHITRQLLRQCSPLMSTSNPFYSCLCALIHRKMSDEQDGAMEFIRLFNCQMPHAAYFISTLALDTNMTISSFAKIIMVLDRAAGLAMTGRAEHGDDASIALGNTPTGVYNVLFMLREVVRLASGSASKRAEEVLLALQRAVPIKTIEALGKLAAQAFQDRDDLIVDPQLLCAELGMLVHELNIPEAMETVVRYFQDTAHCCQYCGCSKGLSATCPVNGTVHVDNEATARRLLTTLAECAGKKAVELKLIALLRDPVTQMQSAVHILLHHVVAKAGQHRIRVFQALEPYIRNTLVTIATSDRSVDASTPSTLKANVMLLHVKLAVLLSPVVDATYVQSILKVFTELQLRSNHDALAVWYMCNVLLRSGKGNVDLLPIDPLETNYNINHPTIAPENSVAADNAQLILHLLDKCLNCSAEMRKLTGCTVCKLIQDFNVQTPNIVSSILGPIGFVPVSLAPLHELALPVGRESTFWNFFVRQLRTSSPARTAFLSTLVKCVSMRFRNHSPAEAMNVEGGEATGHVFTVLMYEAMRRNGALTRLMLHMMCGWLKQKKQLPGKFACLAYSCVQLCSIALTRHDHTDPMESVIESAEDRHQFDEAVKEGIDTIANQLPRMDRLIPEVAQNHAFSLLLKKIHLRSRILLSEATQQPVQQADFDLEFNAMGDDAIRSRNISVASDHPNARAIEPQDMEGFDTNDIVIPIAEDNDIFSNDNGDYGPVAPEYRNEEFIDDGDDGQVESYSDHHSSVKGGNTPHLAAPSSGHFSAHRVPAPPALSSSGVQSIFKPSAGSRPQSEAAAAFRPAMLQAAATQTVQVANAATSTVQSPIALPSLNETSIRHPTQATDVSSGLNSNIVAAASTSTATVVVNAATNTSASKPLDTLGEKEGRKATGGAFFFQRSPAEAMLIEEIRRQPYRVDDSQSKQSNHSSSRSSSNFLRRAHDEENDDSEVEYRDEAPVVRIPGLQSTRVQRRRLEGRPTVESNFVLPSSMVLNYLLQNQNPDSVLHELQDLGDPNALLKMQEAQWQVQHDGERFYSVPHTNRPPQHVALANVAMEPVTNNYCEPHNRVDVAPVSQVRAPIAVQERVYHRLVSNARSGVDGTEDMPPSVRGPSAKRLRDEYHRYEMSRDQVSAHGRSVQWSARPREEHLNVLYNGSADEMPMDLAPSSRHMHNDLGTLGVTPSSQRVLPACLVNQGNESSLRELGQLLGNGHGNRLGPGGASSGKKRFTQAPSWDKENNNLWWTLTSAAPMPQYADDPQYALE